MKVGDYVRRATSKHCFGEITKINSKTAWVDIGWGGLEEKALLDQLVLIQWNDMINRWEDAQ
jgi:hypothetical protein